MDRLAKNPGERILWILRDYATHLYPLQCENDHEASYYRCVIDYWSGDYKLNAADDESERARNYLVSDTEIQRIAAKDAQGRIKVKPPA